MRTVPQRPAQPPALRRASESAELGLHRLDPFVRALARSRAAPMLLEEWVRAYTAALLRQPHLQTPEARSRALGTLREMLMNAILDGVKDARLGDGPARE